MSAKMRPDACLQAAVVPSQAAVARGLQLDAAFTESAVRRMLAGFGEVFYALKPLLCPQTERARARFL